MSERPPAARRVDLRKYPNRRYYDSARSQHVTLDEIYDMVRAGAEVQVTDSKTGEDITAKVLAQIILERDSPKMGIFPVELLHELIRANEPLIRDFVEKYFHQAFTIFLESQRQFDHYLRHAFGLRPPLPGSHEWARMMMGPMAQLLLGGPETEKTESGLASAQGPQRPASVDVAGKSPAVGSAAAGSGKRPSAEELSQLVTDLRAQVAALERELEVSRKSRRATRKATGKRVRRGRGDNTKRGDNAK
jgi:polyhydroxyalkanoate synthesis repressor PhaR